jgi:hypothetical protein
VLGNEIIENLRSSRKYPVSGRPVCACTEGMEEREVEHFRCPSEDAGHSQAGEQVAL